MMKQIVSQTYFDKMYEILKDGNYEDFRQMFFQMSSTDRVHLFQSLYPINKTRLTKCLTREELTQLFHELEQAEEEGAYTDDMNIFEMAKQRLPWIIILIFLGLLSANVIRFFEATIQQVVSLAAFMPLILDSAGNVGTQSLAVAVRRLTFRQETRESFLHMLFKEFGSGILIGLGAFVTIGLISYFLTGNFVLCLITGCSLLITLSFSTVVGYVVPSLFHLIGIDPAVASGPFITTICDLMALLIYFGLATFLIEVL